MACRDIRVIGDDILKKKCRDVNELTPRIKELIADMFETMYKEKGVGLAAPQVGVLRRVVTIDVSDYENGEKKKPIVLINPEIISREGEQIGSEGCLSIPDRTGDVTRAEKVVVEALDEDFKPRRIEACGLLARCIQHEIDHLDGVLFVDRIKEEELRRELKEAKEKQEA